jgi:predicted RNase H-like HicB family nuclease
MNIQRAVRVDHYHIDIYWSDDDNCYIGDVPDLRYCKAHGDSPEEALAEVLVAKQLWLETARELGKPIPPARYKPALVEA